MKEHMSGRACRESADGCLQSVQKSWPKTHGRSSRVKLEVEALSEDRTAKKGEGEGEKSRAPDAAAQCSMLLGNDSLDCGLRSTGTNTMYMDYVAAWRQLATPALLTLPKIAAMFH